jgi:HEAT repeat protein
MWEPFAVLLVGASAASVYQTQSARLRIWRKAITDCGLRLERVSSAMAFRLKLRARGGPLEVRLQATRRSGSSVRITIVIPGPPGFAGVRIRREHYRPEGEREIEIGEDGFDGKFYVEGPMRPVFVLLDAEARDMLLRANALCELEILHGELRVETSDKDLSQLLPILLELGQRFSRRMDVVHCLAENAVGDPVPGVRLRNLRLLIQDHPGASVTIETLRAACTDSSPQVRLRAALVLRAESRPILLELAQSTEDDDVSAQAMAVVGGGLPFEDTKTILDHALRRRRLETARACLEVLGGRGNAPAIEILAKVLAVETGELATAAALALGTAGNAAAEPALIPALQREQEDLLIAAANALARVGSVAAVLPLKEAAERFARNPELQRATRQAIAEIQSRIPGASPGQLSLAGTEAGQLSLAQDEAGQLSLAASPAEEPGG